MTFDRGTAAHLQPRRARLGALGFIGASAIGWAVSGAAQEGRDTLAIWRLTDTAIVQAIGTGIFGQLGSPLSAASFGEPQPWTIHIPDQASEPWLALRAHLRRALNARLPEASDTASSHISIDALELRADSLVVRFTIGFSWVCRQGCRGGNSTGYEMRTWRYRGWWQPPKVQAVLFGDSMPCAPGLPPNARLLLTRP